MKIEVARISGKNFFTEADAVSFIPDIFTRKHSKGVAIAVFYFIVFMDE